MKHEILVSSFRRNVSNPQWHLTVLIDQFMCAIILISIMFLVLTSLSITDKLASISMNTACFYLEPLTTHGSEESSLTVAKLRNELIKGVY